MQATRASLICKARKTCCWERSRCKLSTTVTLGKGVCRGIPAHALMQQTKAPTINRGVGCVGSPAVLFRLRAAAALSSGANLSPALPGRASAARRSACRSVRFDSRDKDALPDDKKVLNGNLRRRPHAGGKFCLPALRLRGCGEQVRWHGRLVYQNTPLPLMHTWHVNKCMKQCKAKRSRHARPCPHPCPALMQANTRPREVRKRGDPRLTAQVAHDDQHASAPQHCASAATAATNAPISASVL